MSKQFITAEQAEDLRQKLDAHIDDVLADIRSLVLSHLEDIVRSYLPFNNPDDDDDTKSF